MQRQADTALRHPTGDIVGWAQRLAEWHLKPLGRRWVHVQRVAARAAEVGWLVGDDQSTLVAAAYLHDIGYAPELARSGFHPLDGARLLWRLGQEQLACLVAHHTGARFEASLRGLDGDLARFQFADSQLDHLLTYCDLTTGPAGDRVTVQERVEEICRRYGPEHVVARSARHCLPVFLELEQDVEQQLAPKRCPKPSPVEHPDSTPVVS